ncbi:MAG: 50S ribosomal protein L15 [Bacteroidetes bacterium]|nr:50S ribosomal protein L15 [Bacteroidota bacterium]MBS1740763.1 50S ribosomal protein L15 [Bacteroidota bacterium]MBS1776427.1 50S ribosomal protein L15 [Bacteroidota bacterium]MBS1781793.1 50S ribosomal protein L15 [Bacteroidota bacterium]
MQLHNLKPAQGATQSRKRVGRGEGGGGTTAGKGNKGQQSRTGYQSKKGHEGGQMPIQRRMPKRGFKSLNRIENKVFNLGQLDFLIEKYSITEFSPEILYITGLINRTDVVKILGNGELKTKMTFKVNAVSAKAKQAIEAAGGTIELV